MLNAIIKFVMSFFKEFMARFLFDQKKKKLQDEIKSADKTAQEAKKDAENKIKKYREYKRAYDAERMRNVIPINRASNKPSSDGEGK